jgi:hypothetical protein
MSANQERPSPHGKTAALAALDRHQVAVHIVVQGREQFVKGRATYESDPDLGNVLRVLVCDPSGEFELVVAEAQWDGRILPGQAVGCDYLIRLS